MKKIKLVAILIGLCCSSLLAQWDTKIVEKNSMYQVELTEVSDGFSKVTIYDEMIKEKAEAVKDSLDRIYNLKNNQLEEDLEMCNSDIFLLQESLKEARRAKRKIERKIKRRDERKANK